MNDELALFIFMMAALTAVTTIILVWMGVRHRDKALGKDDGGQARREVELLTSENASLHGKIDRLEERLAVLERIATDPAERTARQIEQLR